MGEDEKRPYKEERNHRKRNCRGEPRIDHVLVQLAVHRSAACLQCTTKNDEGNDPSCVHSFSLLNRLRLVLIYEALNKNCMRTAPPMEASMATGITTTPTLRKSQKLRS